MRSDDDIGQILKRRIEDQRRSPGVAAGIVSREGRRTFTCGRAAGDRPVASDTLFEIGSITKPFTALMLCDAARRGELALSDPLERWLPAGAKAPAKDGRKITLADLATHQAGFPSFLPGMPPVGEPAWSTYSVADLLRDVGSFELARAPGEGWEYSNTGYALIGLALEQATGRSYAALLSERVLAPLGMASTFLEIAASETSRAADPHNMDGSPAMPIAIGALSPAGALRSTAGDMLTFLAAAAGLTPTPLADAFADMLALRRPAMREGFEQAIGWLVVDGPGGPLVGHDGGTSGMAASALFDPSRQVGVVTLANSTAVTTDFAINLIRPEHRGDEGPPAEIELSPEALERCVGRYRMGPDAVAEITRDGDHIVAKGPNTPPLPMRASSVSRFFSSFVPLTLDFQFAADGAATSMLINFGGQETSAPRIEA